MSGTSHQQNQQLSAQHQMGARSHRDESTICSGENEPAAQSRSAGDNTDVRTAVSPGFKRSANRPRERVPRRVEKSQQTAGTPLAVGARGQPLFTNPRSRDEDNHEMKAATSVIMPPRNNANAPTTITRPGAGVKLVSGTVSIAPTARGTIPQESAATTVGDAPESRDQISARICEMGYRSVLNAEEVSACGLAPQVRSKRGASTFALLQ